MQILFGEYLGEAVEAGIELPDFIRLTRQRYPEKASFFECEDNELLGYYPIRNNKNKYLSTHYVRISTSQEQKVSPFQEIVFLDNFKMETAYFVLNKVQDLREFFNHIVAQFAWDDWLEHYSDTNSNNKADLPDFIRFVRTKDNRAMDFMRNGYQFVKVEYEPGTSGGAIMPFSDDFAQNLKKNGEIEIYTASFDDQSKETRTPNRFK